MYNNTKQPAISVVIIAANEEKFIERALKSIKAQDYQDYEIVVVVNGATDATAAISKRYTPHTLVYPNLLGYSAARNIGAYFAQGKMLVFLDADSYMEQGVLSGVSKYNSDLKFGTVLGKPDNTALIYKIFFAIKNISHILGIYKGVLGGLMFCNASLFKQINGFSLDKACDELNDFSIRARKLGGAYKLITSVYAGTSMRRFEREGILKLTYFWIRIWLLRFIKRGHVIYSEYKATT